MKKIMTRLSYFFLVLTLLSIGLAILAKDKTYNELPKDPLTTITEHKHKQKQVSLPDEDSTLLNSLLSALGGFSGGGLLLIFLIRRLVNSYDSNFERWETRCALHNQQQVDKNNKIIEMIEDIQESSQKVQIDLAKLQANAADKKSVMNAVAKVSVLETDMVQAREEIKSIMSYLLNKSKT